MGGGGPSSDPNEPAVPLTASAVLGLSWCRSVLCALRAVGERVSVTCQCRKKPLHREALRYRPPSCNFDLLPPRRSQFFLRN
jgi:hypothetical protein